ALLVGDKLYSSHCPIFAQTSQLKPFAGPYGPTIMGILPGVLLSVTFLASPVSQPKTMTKAVVRLTGPGIKPGSPAALPKTIYRAGPHYARIEDPPDARQGMRKLTIIAEPDAYSVNLMDKKGAHAIDQGGADDVHMPVVFDPTHKLKTLNHLEFGDELAFFEKAGAEKAIGPIVNNQPTDAYRLPEEEGSAILIVKRGSETPISLSWQTKDGIYTYEYFRYEQLPFNPALFAKPAGISYHDMLPDPNRANE
ncbi:MAG TPA: hypothetical protein VG168_15335, partial [Bryobacteraceae bacterium]|nr:hypothetical protein [Bryobacteraceae bacterium]